MAYLKEMVDRHGRLSKRRHLLVLGGGLHGGKQKLSANAFFHKQFRPILDKVADNGKTVVIYATMHAQSKQLFLYRFAQSNHRIRRYEQEMRQHLLSYFSGRNRTPWFILDTFAFTEQTINQCGTLNPRDGVHYGFCVNTMKSALLMDQLCRVGNVSCPDATATGFALGATCERTHVNGLTQGVLP